MYNYLIVDDESIIRQGMIKFLIDSGLPYHQIYEGANGKKALDILQENKIDIIITDIQMPIMNGLQLLQEVNHRNIEGRVVILSGHEDFQYAKEAMKCGASAYLLKPINQEELITSIKELIVEIEEEKGRNETDKKKTRDNIEREFLCIFHAEVIENNYLTISYLNALSILDKPYKLSLLNFDGDEKEVVGLVEDVNVLLEKEDNGYWMEDKAGYLLIEGDDLYLSTILARAEEKEIEVTVGVSEAAKGIEGLNKSYLEAVKALKTARLFEGSKVMTSEELYGAQLLNEAMLSKEVNRLLLLIGTGKNKEIQEECDRLLGSKNLENQTLEYIEVLEKQLLKAIEEQWKVIVGTDQKWAAERFVFLPFHEVRKITVYRQNVLETILRLDEVLIKMKGVYGNNKNIDNAIQYIHDHYVEDINMAVVSNYVSMSYSFFSQCFKEYTGQNFVDYLKNIRIDKAKEILAASETKVHEIAKMVGFNDERHFMKTFRSLVGVTPTEYRKQIDFQNKLSKTM